MKSQALNGITHTVPALFALGTFIFAYFLVIFEETIRLKKSKPMLLAAGIIWIIVALLGKEHNQVKLVSDSINHILLEYAELLLFIIVAITYVNVLTERKIFEALRIKLTSKSLSYRQLFWLTGWLAFFLSPLVDNLTTAIALSAVVLAVGKGNPRFITLACINLVVAANAGGAFSPFGDITTLMVWQADLVPFTHFIKLFIPALVNFTVPALCMHFAIPGGKPKASLENNQVLKGGVGVIVLFLLTILTTIFFQHNLKLPSTLGMMLGLGYLQIYTFFIKFRPTVKQIEIFPAIKEMDWDTLLFFYGVILSIGGLSTLGYLEQISHILYTNWNTLLSVAHQHTPGNIIIGALSAIVDNIPLMFAVISAHPIMSEGQWLLLTLTTGVGGSLLSIGSAAGIGVMGQAPKNYTFFSHLKWSWAIALGYILSVICHLWLNANYF